MSCHFAKFWQYLWKNFENRLTLFYLLTGGLWILLSDKLLYYSTFDPLLITRVQTYKGWLFVIISGLIVWIISKSYAKRLRQKMKELAEALEKVEQSNRLKTQFLQNISHEVRTPLNGIIGFSELLLEINSPGIQGKEYAYYINKNAEELKSFLDKVMDVSMIDSGTHHVSKSQASLYEFTTELKIEAEYLAGLFPHLNFLFEMADNCHGTQLMTDTSLLMKCLKYVLENAFQYTDQGSVRLRVYVDGRSAHFEIGDTGRGIPDSEQEMIFEKFRRTKQSEEQDTRGAGMGLYIVRNYIALLNGKLYFESQVNRGTIFIISIPLAYVYGE